MKVLMIYPKFADSFWGFKHALSFVFKKAVTPPLGLLTLANLLPPEWDVRLTDMNVRRLKKQDIRQADLVFVSAIQLQAASLSQVIRLCKKYEKKIIAGGPLFTSNHTQYPDIHHFILNEAEITFPLFLQDWHAGKPKKIYTTSDWADMTTTPHPRWNLVNTKDYFLMTIQYSRGCPFNCDFCDITKLFGNRQRTKSTDQILKELDQIYTSGWRDQVLFVDDNFIGNKQQLKNELLPAIADWMKHKHFPFTFYTQVSLNLADDDALLSLMTAAGFDTVFIGIETTHEASLQACAKHQNLKRDLVGSVKKIQRSGLQVQGGFIVGFDQDPPHIFQDQIAFIQKSGIVTAMVGLLQPLFGTRLYSRLEKENRLLEGIPDNNTDGTLYFTPHMGKKTLLTGYHHLAKTIYSPANYYARIQTFFSEYQLCVPNVTHKNIKTFIILLKISWFLGVVGKERQYYWRLFFQTLFTKPKQIRLYMTLAVFGYHHRKHFERLAKTP